MFETFRVIRTNMMLTAIAFFVIGIVLLIYPDTFLKMACYILGALFVAYGVLGILRCIREHVMYLGTLLVSVFALAAGIFVITQPKTISSILPIIIGLILFLDGVFNIRHALGLHKFGDGAWKFILILGIITVAFGAVILFNPYSTATFTFRLIGIALVYNGVSDFIVLFRMNQASKTYEGQKIIDVEARPVDDDKEDDT